MRLALCTEVLRELPFGRQCTLAAKLGYESLELIARIDQRLLTGP